MTTLVHLALDSEDVVKAIFMNSLHCDHYCTEHDFFHIPFNVGNRAGISCPSVGTVYHSSRARAMRSIAQDTLKGL